MKAIIFYSVFLSALSAGPAGERALIPFFLQPEKTVTTAVVPAAGKEIAFADLEEGTYYIRCRAGSQKYLDVSWSCRNESSCKVQLWSLGNTTSNNKWVIKKEGISLLGEYSIKSVVNGKYLTSYGDDNGDPINVQDREKYLIQTDPRGISTWKFEVISISAGLYKIKNKACNKYLDAANGCVNDNGCKVQIWSGEGNALSSNWFLVKAN